MIGGENADQLQAVLQMMFVMSLWGVIIPRGGMFGIALALGLYLAGVPLRVLW